ncbi:unnamed protein product, partial [Polarella glacialis]
MEEGVRPGGHRSDLGDAAALHIMQEVDCLLEKHRAEVKNCLGHWLAGGFPASEDALQLSKAAPIFRACTSCGSGWPPMCDVNHSPSNALQRLQEMEEIADCKEADMSLTISAQECGVLLGRALASLKGPGVPADASEAVGETPPPLPKVAVAGRPPSPKKPPGRNISALESQYEIAKAFDAPAAEIIVPAAERPTVVFKTPSDDQRAKLVQN